ncbi:MAG: FkbM family methyltransferase [Gammaproteobacteria bacterium]|nr:FkbM family methyltransferase [Gammaproteobacteria bacterium]
MIRRTLSEAAFRLGRHSSQTALLEWAIRLDPHWLRPAQELVRRGKPEAAGAILSWTLASLRGCRDAGSMTPGLPEESRNFLMLAAELLPLSHGQCFQDVAALFFAAHRKNGFFVEVGTGDGVRLSNTYMLERDFAWSGILFEPDRRNQETIRARRRAMLDVRAAFSEDGRSLSFVECSGSTALSTLKAFRRNNGRLRQGAVNEVVTVRLDTALEAANAPRMIDYISIDTEGSELEVLEGLDLARWRVRFLTIEHNYVPGRREELARRLGGQGYRQVLPEFSCMDSWFVRE